MSKMIGVVPSTDPESPFAIVSTSSAGVEFQCDAEFTLKPEAAIQYATLIMQAAQARVEAERELVGQINDPEKLAALIPPGDEGVMMNGKRLTRVVRRRKTS